LTEFAFGEDTWRARLGTLRQVVRQELLSRQLAEHVPDWPRRRILDLGCGQGTQLLRLARQGHEVTGLDGSARLLEELGRSLEAEPAPVRERVRVVRGEVLEAPDLLGGQHFDVVLCHGVLMYFADPLPLLAVVSRLTAAGGLVSLLVRNGDALAMRAGLHGDWKAAGEAFDGMSYRNRLGVQARADRRAELIGRLRTQQLTVRRWYGVRVFTDLAADEAAVPEPAELGQLLDCEERAGRTDPYRAVAPLLHLVAQRTLADRPVSRAPVS
jgi:S-adenosylmethionine-dependent methyltransferase